MPRLNFRLGRKPKRASYSATSTLEPALRVTMAMNSANDLELLSLVAKMPRARSRPSSSTRARGVQFFCRMRAAVGHSPRADGGHRPPDQRGRARGRRHGGRGLSRRVGRAGAAGSAGPRVRGRRAPVEIERDTVEQLVISGASRAAMAGGPPTKADIRACEKRRLTRRRPWKGDESIRARAAPLARCSCGRRSSSCG